MAPKCASVGRKSCRSGTRIAPILALFVPTATRFGCLAADTGIQRDLVALPPLQESYVLKTQSNLFAEQRVKRGRPRRRLYGVGVYGGELFRPPIKGFKESWRLKQFSPKVNP